MNSNTLTEARTIIAGFMRQRREELKLTQSDVAARIGCTWETISRLERGVFWPAMPQYLKWCEALALFPSISMMGADDDIAEALRSTWVSSPSISTEKAERLLEIIKAKAGKN